MGYQQKDDSLANALVNAFELAEIEIDYTVEDLVYLIYNYMTPDTLEIGDVVVSVNGGDIYTETSNTQCGEDAVFDIIRDGVEMSFTLTKNYFRDDLCGFGVYINPFTTIHSSALSYEVNRNHTSGSSGGLLQSLYIFNLVTPNDMTGGNKIAGTGTIDAYGNVGRIGGIDQKIITSALNGIDIFFVPYLSDSETDNYIEAQAVLATLQTDMILVPVQTLDDAITYLESRFGGAYDE
jgi:PDZ domain-containing protein